MKRTVRGTVNIGKNLLRYVCALAGSLSTACSRTPNMGDASYDLRSALADALPAAGPTRSAVKAMHDTGYGADPKNSNNDMKDLFVGLKLAGGSNGHASSEDGGQVAPHDAASSALAEGTSEAAGQTRNAAAAQPSAAQALLEYRREKKAAQKAVEVEAARLVAAGAGAGQKRTASGGISRVGLARAAGVAGLDVAEASQDERHLRKVNVSKTAARMSSKQKRRRKQSKEQGEGYEEKYAGKLLNKSKRKGRMLAMKQMY